MNLLRHRTILSYKHTLALQIKFEHLSFSHDTTVPLTTCYGDNQPLNKQRWCGKVRVNWYPTEAKFLKHGHEDLDYNHTVGGWRSRGRQKLRWRDGVENKRELGFRVENGEDRQEWRRYIKTANPWRKEKTEKRWGTMVLFWYHLFNQEPVIYPTAAHNYITMYSECIYYKGMSQLSRI